MGDSSSHPVGSLPLREALTRGALPYAMLPLSRVLPRLRSSCYGPKRPPSGYAPLSLRLDRGARFQTQLVHGEIRHSKRGAAIRASHRAQRNTFGGTWRKRLVQSIATATPYASPRLLNYRAEQKRRAARRRPSRTL